MVRVSKVYMSKSFLVPLSGLGSTESSLKRDYAALDDDGPSGEQIFGSQQLSVDGRLLCYQEILPLENTVLMLLRAWRHSVHRFELSWYYLEERTVA